MRILKENNQEYRHKCKYCKSIYAYTIKDVDWTWFNHIRCPVCKQIDKILKSDRKVKQCKIKK